MVVNRKTTVKFQVIFECLELDLVKFGYGFRTEFVEDFEENRWGL